MQERHFEIGLLGITLVIISFIVGVVLGANHLTHTSFTMMKPAQTDIVMHVHEAQEVEMPYPTLTMEVIPDTKAGWNVYLETTNFNFAPENVNQSHQAGEGHAHLYINDIRITRLYGPWYYIPDLPAGDNTIMVNLSGNEHSDLTINGNIIKATRVVTVE